MSTISSVNLQSLVSFTVVYNPFEPFENINLGIDSAGLHSFNSLDILSPCFLRHELALFFVLVREREWRTA